MCGLFMCTGQREVTDCAIEMFKHSPRKLFTTDLSKLS